MGKKKVTAIRKATKKETKLIREASRCTHLIKAYAIARESIYQHLAKTAKDQLLLVNIEKEFRAIQLSRPKGKYVSCPEIDFTVNRVATKTERLGK